MRHVWITIAMVALAVTPLAAAEEVTPHSVAGTKNATISLEDDFTHEIGEGFDAIQAGRPDWAIDIFDKVIAQYEKSHSSKSYYCATSLTQALAITTSKMVSGKKDEPAIEVLGSSWCDAVFGKGFALIDLKRDAEAEPYLLRAVEMAPLNAHFLNELAEFYKSRREWQHSYDLFEEARDLGKQDYVEATPAIKARSLRGLAYNLVEMGKLNDAERLYTESLTLMPGHAGALSEIDYIRQLRAKPIGN